jgi:hypothetical protein
VHGDFGRVKPRHAATPSLGGTMAKPDQFAVSMLVPHSKNEEIYEHPSGEAWTAFVASIRASGVLDPLIIASDWRIVSGHRRYLAAKEVGLSHVPCIMYEYANEDDVLHALVEYNRYRVKTIRELMREATVVQEVEERRAKARQVAAAWGTVKENLPEQDTGTKGQTRDKVAAAIGMSGRTYDKLRYITDKGASNDKVRELIDRIDKGESSIDSVFKSIKYGEREATDFDPKVYNFWFFGRPDPKYGQMHPGQIHPGILENVLHLYTNEGDLVVDPFAGGGIAIDVCKVWNRRCIALDIDPRREDILKHDIRTGFPSDAADADLVFYDPPYWNMVAEDYSADGAGSYTLSDFIEFLRYLAGAAKQTLKVGGFAAYIIMPQYYRLPDGVPMLDWPLLWARFFMEAGMTQVQRVSNMWPTSIWQAFHVTKAKEEGRLLPIMGDLVVFQRRN